MNIVVCVKQIPDPEAPQSFDASNNLNRSGKLLLDKADEYGVEMALQLVDKAGGGEVTVVSMGSATDVAGLRNALAMGATKAVIVSDDSLRGSDALSTAKVLAAVIRRSPFDLVLAATESSDGYTGTTPVQLAELLGLPSITFAKAVAIEDSTVKVSRQTEAGYDEVTVLAPRPRHRDGRRRGASLRLLQGHHGRQVQAARDSERGATSLWTARWAPRARARPSRPSRRPRAARPVRSTWMRVTAPRRSWRSSNRSRSSRRF